MMRSGWNPTKRNRNIGTEEQGKGQDNRHVIPWSRHHDYYKLDVATYKIIDVHGHKIKVVTERTLRGYRHSCTVEDIVSVLNLLPKDDLDGMGLIVLRQPTKKQKTLWRCWGFIVFETNVENYRGPVIFLEAMNLDIPLIYSKSLTPFWAKKISILKNDGLRIIDQGREYKIIPNNESVRRTQLYTTIPHEIGHYVDYKQSSQKFNEKTYIDQETFADRYAEKFRKQNNTL